MLVKLAWIWLICGTIVALKIGYELYTNTEEELYEELDDESIMVFEMIGGKLGTVLVCFLLGPIALMSALFMGDDEEE